MTPVADPPSGFVRCAVVPDLLVSDLDASLSFWCGLCGFSVAYDRPEDRFAYLDRAGPQVMLEEVMAPGRRWITAPLQQPFGRGINFQIAVDDVAPILAGLKAAGWPLFLGYRQLGCRLACEMRLRRVGERHDDSYLPELRRLPLPA